MPGPILGPPSMVFPSGKPSTKMSPQQALNVRALQQQLVRAGYKIKVTGQLDPLTKSALKDYLQPNAQHPLSAGLEQALGGPQTSQLHKSGTTYDIHGARNPGAWNAAHGLNTPPTHTSVPNTPPAAVTNSRSTATNTDPSGGARTTASTGSVPYGGITSPTERLLPMSLAQFGQMVSPSTAQDIAGAQYDPQIAAAQLQLQLDPGQFAQNLKDITSWYGQVQAAQKTAATNVASMGGSGTGSIGDAAAALAASLGGSANQGAHDIAQSGDIAKGTEAALAQAANTYEQNMGPILAAEGAEQKVNQQNKDATQLLADRSALAALQSSRGQAAQAALAQITGENNSLAQARAQMAASLIGANNSTKQQAFSNNLALLNAEAAAQSMGIDTQQKLAELANTASEIRARSVRNDQPAYAANHPFKYYQQHDPTFLSEVASKAGGSLVDAQGNKLNITPQQAWNVVSSVYRAHGFNPVPGTPSYNAAQSVLQGWVNS